MQWYQCSEYKEEGTRTLAWELINATAFRSWEQWLNDGEKPSKYFCLLHKYNYNEKTIKCVHLDCCNRITYQKEILNEAQKFYFSLFQPKMTQT